MMSPRLRRWTITIAGLVTAGLVIVFSFRARTPSSLHLPDGRIVRIQAVTYGTNHLLTVGPWWAKLARPFLSPARVMALGRRTFSLQTVRPSMVVWTEWQLPSSNAGPARALSVRNRSGPESEPAGAALWDVLPSNGSRRRLTSAWQVSNFPRAERQLELCWYDRDAQFQPVYLGQMRIRNPSPTLATTNAGNDPAAPLPHTIAHGSTKFTLEAAGIGRPPVSKRRPPLAPFQKISPGGFLTIGIEEKGQLSKAWAPRQVIARSADGNWFEYGAPTWARIEPGRFQWTFDDVLWPAALGGWRFNVQFVRQGEFEPGQLWVAPAIQPPSKGQDVERSVKVTRDGLEIHGILARFIPSGLSGYNLDFQPNAHLVLKFDRPGASAEVRLALASVVDERGLSLRHTSGLEVTDNALMADVFIPEGTQTLTPTFAIHRAIPIEFHVQPGQKKDSSALP